MRTILPHHSKIGSGQASLRVAEDPCPATRAPPALTPAMVSAATAHGLTASCGFEITLAIGCVGGKHRATGPGQADAVDYVVAKL